MNDMTDNLAPEVADSNDQVVGFGKYGVQVSVRDGIVRLTIRHSGSRLLPVGLFGRVVMTKMVRLALPGHVSTLVNGRAGLVFDNTSPGQSSRTVILDPCWPIDVREEARRQIDAALHHGGRAVSLQMSGVTAAVAGAVALMLVAAAFGSGAPRAAEPAAVPAEAARLSPTETEAMSSAALAAKAAEQGNGLEHGDALSKAYKIPLRAAAPGKPTLFVWSDPLCPHCRDFEQKVVGQLPQGIGLTFVPVSFKDGSRPLVSFVACGSSERDRAARWTNLMSATPSEDFTAQCKKGPEVADANTVLFARAGLTATPTLMKPDGSVFDGDRDSVSGILKWLAN